MLDKNTIAAITRAAIRWSTHARAAGCRFAIDQKAAEATAFTISQGGRSFALPSKLEGTAAVQHTLTQLAQAIAQEQWQALTLAESPNADSARRGEILALWHGEIVGRVRPKHVRWLAPLLATGFVRCYVLQITGGDPGPNGKPKTRGCNIVYTGLGLALDALARQRERDEKARSKTAFPAPTLNGHRAGHVAERPPVYRYAPASTRPPLVCERDAKGRFLPGPDPDRHAFTPEECRQGFRAAVASIMRRYPTAVRTDEETGHTFHIARAFLARKHPDQYEAIIEQRILDRWNERPSHS